MDIAVDATDGDIQHTQVRSPGPEREPYSESVTVVSPAGAEVTVHPTYRTGHGTTVSPYRYGLTPEDWQAMKAAWAVEPEPGPEPISRGGTGTERRRVSKGPHDGNDFLLADILYEGGYTE